MNTKTANAPRISIAMATYNGSKYLLEQLDSLAAQTLLPFELVVTDDGSTDATLDILDAFSKRVSFPVHIHRNEQRLGYRDNFLKAARLCCGDLIAFCDQDDVWAEDKLRVVAPAFEESVVLLAFHDATVVTEKLEKVVDRRSPDCATPFSVQLGFTMIFRADLPFSANIARPRCDRSADGSLMAHDQWISFLADSLGKCRHICQTLVRYRQHGNNTCGYGGGIDARQRLAKVARTQPSRYLQLSEYASERAQTLKALVATRTLSGSRHARVEVSVARWERYARLLLLRAAINADGSSFLTRQKHFLLAMSQFGYSQTLLGRKALLKDAFVAVFGAKALSRVLISIE